MAKRSSVFINCPFDEKYKPLFNAILFTIMDCGFEPTCALAYDDSGHVRVNKIYRLIASGSLGIHDISRTELDERTNLPRFNVPFELGLYLGAKAFGKKKHERKVTLILDSVRYRYQKYLSDIAGQDIHAHGDEPRKVVEIVRNWLQSSVRKEWAPLPSGALISDRYDAFVAELPALCKPPKLVPRRLTYGDYLWLAKKWLARNAWKEG